MAGRGGAQSMLPFRDNPVIADFGHNGQMRTGSHLSIVTGAVERQ
jgi:hypothetical protein